MVGIFLNEEKESLKNIKVRDWKRLPVMVGTFLNEDKELARKISG